MNFAQQHSRVLVPTGNGSNGRKNPQNGRGVYQRGHKGRRNGNVRRGTLHPGREVDPHDDRA